MDADDAATGPERATEEEWRALRRGLADALEVLADGELLWVATAEPIVFGSVAGNLGVLVEPVGSELELEITVPAGTRTGRLPRRGVEQAAVIVVRVLRDELGLPHPSFVALDPLDGTATRRPGVLGPADERGTGAVDSARPPGPPAGGASPPQPQGPPVEVTTPRDSDHLRQLVDATLRQVLGAEVRHDPDGDVAVRDGASVCWVRVAGGRPVVELESELAVGVDVAAAPGEVALLNEEHERWKFLLRDDAVVMRTEVLALPFCDAHLQIVLRLFLDAMDDLARRLVRRVGGRRYLDEDIPAPATAVTPAAPATASTEVPLPVEVEGLVELLVLGPVRAGTVAGLFGRDRLAIIGALVAVRGSASAHAAIRRAGVEPDRVLTAMRQGLRLVSDGPRPGTGDVPPRRHSVQQPLLTDVDVDDDTLDLGWPR